MPLSKHEIVYYELPSGKSPFRQWYHSLDRKTQGIIDARIERVELGNFGEHRYLTRRILELKFRVGPGYQIYLGIDRVKLILLLDGGDKGSQKKDIRKARKYWQSYLKEKCNAN